MSTLRFGALGAARIAPAALIHPSAKLDRCEVVAIAARDPARAEKFADKHGIANAVDSYAELVAHPEVDAVYNGLPASHHARWTLEALRADKHVLCEKPFTTSAEEAAEMVSLADERGLVCCEAFHYRYHPLMARVLELCGGAMGRIERMEGYFYAPIGDLSDIRYVLALGGGAIMDLGCYPIHWMRTILGEEPEVVRAVAQQKPAGVDEEMEVELRFPGGATGFVGCNMAKEGGFKLLLRVEGSEGELSVDNLIAPGFGHVLRWRDAAGEHKETVAGGSTFDYQLEAFAAAVLDGSKLLTGGEDAIANMRVIDAIYRAAELPPRRQVVSHT